MWRGAVRSASRGKRGQAMFREMLDALDAMPVKELIRNQIVELNGQRCAFGVLGEKRGLDLADVDPEDNAHIAQVFGVAHALACEVMYENDEAYRYDETPAERWTRMRAWVAGNILKTEDELV
jgi:hypothetical protein